MAFASKGLCAHQHARVIQAVVRLVALERNGRVFGLDVGHVVGQLGVLLIGPALLDDGCRFDVRLIALRGCGCNHLVILWRLVGNKMERLDLENIAGTHILTTAIQTML